MKVLILSLDPSILNPDSEAYSRMEEYATFADELYIFVFTHKHEALRILTRSTTNNLFVYPFSASMFGWVKALFFGRKLIKEKSIDVVSAQESFEIGLLGWLIARQSAGLNIQLHGDFYGNEYWRKERMLNGLRWHLGLFVLRRANSIRVVSERIKQNLVSSFKFQVSRIVRVPIYTDVELYKNAQSNFSLKEKYSQFDFIILTVANLVSVKNLDFLIRAMERLHKMSPKAGLIIVGAGLLQKKLQATSYKLQANDYVIFEGAQKDLASYYKGADCFVLVSKYEGWGRAVVEASASGLPIVITDVGLAGEFIKNNDTGLVLNDFDEAELASKLFKIYTDQNLKNRLVANAETAIKSLPPKQEILNLIKKSWEMAINKKNLN